MLYVYGCAGSDLGTQLSKTVRTLRKFFRVQIGA